MRDVCNRAGVRAQRRGRGHRSPADSLDARQLRCWPRCRTLVSVQPAGIWERLLGVRGAPVSGGGVRGMAPLRDSRRGGHGIDEGPSADQFSPEWSGWHGDLAGPVSLPARPADVQKALSSCPLFRVWAANALLRIFVRSPPRPSSRPGSRLRVELWDCLPLALTAPPP